MNQQETAGAEKDRLLALSSIAPCGRCSKPKGERGVEGFCNCGRPTKYKTYEFDSLNGNDETGDGSKEKPFRTKEKAQEEADEYMIAKVDEYLKQSIDDWNELIDKPVVKLPTHEGFAIMLDVDVTTLYEWEKEHPKFSQSLSKIVAFQKERLFSKGLSGEYNPTIAKLILSSNHGMAEKTETDVTSKGEQVQGLAVSFKDVGKE